MSCECVPTKKNPLCILIGKVFSHTFVVYTDTTQTTLKDFTGYTGRAHLRIAADTADPPLATFTVTFGGVAGTLTLSLTAVQTTALVEAKKRVWDVEWTAPGDAAKIVFRGLANVETPVTR